jgi:stress response protein YsnF
MLDDEVVIRLLDHGTVQSADGLRLGRVGQLFRSDSDGESTWVSIDTGDALQTLVPMAGATVVGDDLRVAYPAAAVTGAPQVAVGAPVSGDDEQRVSAFYRLDRPAGGDTASTDVLTVVRSEERLSVGTQWVPVRRARLEKFQVTETRTIEVPWTREDVRVVYDDLTGTEPTGTQPTTGAPTSSAPTSSEPTTSAPRPWVLMAERIVVTKEWVPAERVHLVVDRVAGEQDVTGSVRREQVALDHVDNVDRVDNDDHVANEDNVVNVGAGSLSPADGSDPDA